MIIPALGHLSPAWKDLPRGQHRVLVRRKKAPDDVITRLIQIQGLEKGVALSASQIGEALQVLWTKGKSLS